MECWMILKIHYSITPILHCPKLPVSDIVAEVVIEGKF